MLRPSRRLLRPGDQQCNDDRDNGNGDGDGDERIGNVLLTGCECCYRLSTGTTLDDNLDNILVV